MGRVIVMAVSLSGGLGMGRVIVRGGVTVVIVAVVGMGRSVIVVAMGRRGRMIFMPVVRVSGSRAMLIVTMLGRRSGVAVIVMAMVCRAVVCRAVISRAGGMAVVIVALGRRGGRMGGMVVVTLGRVGAVTRAMTVICAVIVVRLVLVAHCHSFPSRCSRSLRRNRYIVIKPSARLRSPRRRVRTGARR